MTPFLNLGLNHSLTCITFLEPLLVLSTDRWPFPASSAYRQLIFAVAGFALQEYGLHSRVVHYWPSPDAVLPGSPSCRQAAPHGQHLHAAYQLANSAFPHALSIFPARCGRESPVIC